MVKLPQLKLLLGYPSQGPRKLGRLREAQEKLLGCTSCLQGWALAGHFQKEGEQHSKVKYGSTRGDSRETNRRRSDYGGLCTNVGCAAESTQSDSAEKGGWLGSLLSSQSSEECKARLTAVHVSPGTESHSPKLPLGLDVSSLHSARPRLPNRASSHTQPAYVAHYRLLSTGARPLPEPFKAKEKPPEAALSSQAGAPSHDEANAKSVKSSSVPVRSSVLDGPTTSVSQWLQHVCPPVLWPYVQLGRYDKPIGTWLLAWPCFWSIAFAADPGALPDLALMAWFGAGAIVMRGAGCTVNDMWDKDIDNKVARTLNRPIASKTISPKKAFLFLAAQSTVGLGVLLQLNDFSRVLGASSLFLVATYPLMKRMTSWPQAYLGLTFNWGALLGWAAVQGGLYLPAVAPLYAAGICWTLVYDTIYAHQDKEDDKLVGVKSTALRFGAATPQWLTGFGAATLAGLAASGHAVGLEWPFYAGLSAAGAHLTWQIASLKMDDRGDCSRKFVSNKWFGAIVFASIVAGKMTAG